MQLNASHKRELKIVPHMGEPVWPGFPPNQIDCDLYPDLADYVENGFVKRTGRGCWVTGNGLRALNG